MKRTEKQGRRAGVVAKSGCNCGSLLNDSGKKFDKGQWGKVHAAYVNAILSQA